MAVGSSSLFREIYYDHPDKSLSPPPSLEIILFEDFLREDTHKEKLFFSGRTTNRRGGGNPLTPLTNKQKPTFFSMIKKSTKKNDKKNACYV